MLRGNILLLQAEGGQGAWQHLERIGTEISTENPKVIKKMPLHMNPEKEKYEKMDLNERNNIMLSSYCMDSETGNIIGLSYQAIEPTFNDKSYNDVYGEKGRRMMANPFQYISRKGTLPVLAFDGRSFTNNPPKLEETQEMQDLFFKLEGKVKQVMKGILGDYVNDGKTTEQELWQRFFLESRPVIVDYVANPKNEILKPHCFKYYSEDGIKMVSDQVWGGFMHSFDFYKEQLRQENNPDLGKPVQGKAGLVVTDFVATNASEKSLAV